MTGRVLQLQVGDKAACGRGAGGHSGGTWGHVGAHPQGGGPSQLGTGTHYSPQHLRGGAPAPCIALLPNTEATRHTYFSLPCRGVFLVPFPCLVQSRSLLSAITGPFLHRV